MSQEQKAQIIQEIGVKFKEAALTLLTDYKGLKANDINELRHQLRSVGSQMKVYKNTLAKRAILGSEMEGLKEFFEGTVAAVTVETDAVAATKVLTKFVKEFEKPQIKAGFMSGKILSPQEIETLSKLPSREEMLSKLLGSLQAPAQNLVNVLAEIPRRLATVLAAVRDKKGES